MAKYQFGINGPFTGKLGTVVGCTWKGIPYMRSLPKKRTTQVSEAERLNREKFATAQLWLKPLTAFLRVGFKGYQERMEGFTAAKSYLLKNALELQDGIFWVNPERALLSYGTLEMPIEVGVELRDNFELKFWWSAGERLKVSSARDQAMMVAYCLAEKEVIYETHGAFRETRTDKLTLPAHFKGKNVLVYLAFVAGDRTSQSNSVFLGEVTVPID
ncbi:MAG TPA: DUF6266 family protein [Pelobium sp.]|nr:DUF6266 family protein [Pelobium sp.]